MINPNGIKANEKPMSEDLSFVYAEDSNKDFVRVSKEVLKLLLGVATKLSELDNDENFINNMVDDLKNYYLKSETYTREEIDDKLSLVPRFSVKVVTTLPTEGISDTTVYLVPSNEDEENLYTEYINVNGLWEILGAQKIAKFEVTKEDIESALGYVPADNEKVLQIENDVKSKLSEAELSSAIEEALRQAKESGEFDGANGITPHIGNNGNWYLGEEDTNVKAQGIDGRGIKSLEKTSSTGNIDTYTITYTDGTKFMYNVVNASNESGGIVAETDPTVPSWAKQPTKPSYTAQEVGALPNTTKIPVNTSDLNNDNEFITKTVTDLVNYYTKSQSYSKDEIDNKLSAIPKFSIQPVEQLPTTNISETTVYLLKTGDEENNLYTEYIYVDNKWEYLGKQTIDLSGYALKTEIPTKLSELTNDAGFITNTVSNLVNYYSKSETYSKAEIDAKGFLTEHQDLSDYAKRSEVPKNLAQLNQDSTHRVVTDSQVETWNNKSNFSGDYKDLTGKPTIPSKTSQLANDSNFAVKEDIPTELPASDVYSWAKKPQKPTYSASEVGALPNTTEIPEKTSDLTNDSGFITKAVNDLANYYLKSQTYSAEEIDNKISTIPKFGIEVVTSLPTTNISNTTVYLIASGNEQDNLYTEYIYVNGKWEYLGKQTVDLSGYVKRTELSSYYNKTEIDSLLQTIRNSIEEVQKMPVVRYDSQELTEKQKTQARTNIGAASEEVVTNLQEQIADYVGGVDGAVGTTFPPSQKPASVDCDGYDIDIVNVLADDVFEYIDEGVNGKKTVTKEILGKDESGVYDIARYTFANREYCAWVKDKYPKMYAWKNGNTIKYTESVSPRIDENAFDVPYLKTVLVGGGETVPNFTNIKDQCTFKYGQRWSLSGGAFKSVPGSTYVIVPVPTGKTTVTLRFKGYTQNTSYQEWYGGTSDNSFTENLGYPAEADTYGKITADENGIYTCTMTKTSSISHIGVLMVGGDASAFADTIITVDEPIEYVVTGGDEEVLDGTPITEVSASNRSRTINGVQYVRYEDGDVEPTLIYTDIDDERNGDESITKDDVTYYRYPLGDLGSNRKKLIPIFIYANEHGYILNNTYEGHETKMCALVVARFLRDLASDKQMKNPLYKYIRENCMLISIPVVNPFGYNINITGGSGINTESGYMNVNRCNINRNYDTPGWDYMYENDVVNDNWYGHYAGSQNETQYVMNTMVASGAVVAMSLHGHSGSPNMGAVQGQDPDGTYFNEEGLTNISNFLESNYGYKLVDYDVYIGGSYDEIGAHNMPNVTCKSPSYITQCGAYGGIVEFSPFEADATNKVVGYSSIIIENAYAQMLNLVALWLSDYLNK